VSGSDEFKVSDRIFIINVLCGCNVRVWLYSFGTWGSSLK